MSSLASASGSLVHVHRGSFVAAFSFLGALVWLGCYSVIQADEYEDATDPGGRDDARDAEPRCRTDADCEDGTSCVLGSCVCVVVDPVYPRECSEEPGEIGSGTSSACAAAPVDETVVAGDVAARDVGIWVDVIPNPLVADGLEHGIVQATITELSSGRRVVGAPVTFVSAGLDEAPDGTILDACDEYEIGVPYNILALIWLREGTSYGNVVEGVTGPDGTVQVDLRPPTWSDYMADRPLLLGAWYYVDGGGDPFAGRLVYLVPP